MPKTNRKPWSAIFSTESIEFYLSDPVAFVEDIIFAEKSKANGGELYLSDQQKEVLMSLATGKRISIRSGRGIGKTALLVYILIWFLCTRPYSKIIITAPTAKQLYIQLWPELERWYRNSKILKELFVWTNKKFYAWESPASWFAISTTTDTAEGIQGAHNPHLLLLVDEASGVEDDIFNTLSGSLTQEDNLIVIAGNPTQTSGFFFDSHNKARDQWKTFHFSSEKSPFVTEEFILDFESRYGRDHPMFKVHVMGEFPEGSPESFISLEQVLKATQRTVPETGIIQIGVDVAHFGDDLTAIGVRIGNKLLPIETKNQTSVPETIGLVLSKVKHLREKYNYKNVIKVCVDVGGVGAGVCDGLALDRECNIEVVPINFGSYGDDLHEYMASVLWDTFKQHVHEMEIPDDDKLISELTNRRYRITPTGKVRIEPKSEYKKRHTKSPDRADAAILAWANVENPSKILKGFDHLNKSFVCDLSTIGYMSDSEKYCSIYQSRDRMFHILLCNWSGNKLYITNEMETDENVGYIARNILSKGTRFEKISGNERLFGEHGEDVSSQFRKYGLSIYENYRYDEPGAMECLNLIITDKRIMINNSCSKLITQLRTWSTNKTKTQLETEYGMCYCLLNIISELKEKILRQEVAVYIPAYTGIKDKLLRNATSRRKINNKEWLKW